MKEELYLVRPISSSRNIYMQSRIIRFAAGFLLFGCVTLGDPSHAEDKLKQPSTHEQSPQQKKIARLIDTIDDDIDLLHGNFSPSVHALISIGLPALDPLIEKMRRVEKGSGLRVETAIEGIVGTDLNDYRKVKDFWKAVGELDYEASAEERIKVTQNIRDWYKKRDTKLSPVVP